MAKIPQYLAFQFASEENLNAAYNALEENYNDLKLKKTMDTFPYLYVEDKFSMNFNLTIQSICKKYQGKLVVSR